MCGHACREGLVKISTIATGKNGAVRAPAFGGQALQNFRPDSKLLFWEDTAGIRSVMIETARGAVGCVRSGEGAAVLLLHGAMGGYDQGLHLGQIALGSTGFEFIAVSPQLSAPWRTLISGEPGVAWWN